MDWLTFIATIIKALVWPGLLLTVVIMFRKGFATTLPALASRLSSAELPGGGKLTFSEKIQAIEESPSAVALLNDVGLPAIDQLTPHSGGMGNADVSPSEMIEDAWLDFVEWVKAKAKQGNVDTEHSLGIPYMVGRLMANHTPKEADHVIDLYREVAELRKGVSLEPWKVTVDDAARFGRLLELMRTRLEK